MGLRVRLSRGCAAVAALRFRLPRKCALVALCIHAALLFALAAAVPAEACPSGSTFFTMRTDIGGCIDPNTKKVVAECIALNLNSCTPQNRVTNVKHPDSRKVWCCPTKRIDESKPKGSCRWVGEGPFCGGKKSDCDVPYEEYIDSASGSGTAFNIHHTFNKPRANFGSHCERGVKVLCCTRGAQMTRVSPPPPPKHFAGTWSTITSDNVAYTVTLAQTGGAVSGNYLSTDGSTRGTIEGGVAGNVLRFVWSQSNGTGAGKFTLSGDGKSFKGTYSNTSDADRKDGDWNGSKQ